MEDEVPNAVTLGAWPPQGLARAEAAQRALERRAVPRRGGVGLIEDFEQQLDALVHAYRSRLRSDEIDQREAVCVALEHNRRNLTREDVEYLRMHVRLLFAKENRGGRLNSGHHLGAVHACRDVGGEGTLRGSRGRIALLLRRQLVDLGTGLQREEREVLLDVAVVHVDPELVKFVC